MPRTRALVAPGDRPRVRIQWTCAPPTAGAGVKSRRPFPGISSPQRRGCFPPGIYNPEGAHPGGA